MYTRVYVYVEKILKAKGKLLLRGGIMRKSRNGQVRAFAAITKFWVLLMCFAVVFALVLTTGVLDGDTGANVAKADQQVDNIAQVHADATGDIDTRLISTDYIVEGDKKHWRVEVKVGAVTSDNVSIWFDEGSGLSITSGTGGFTATGPNQSAWTGSYSLFVGVNYAIPAQYIASLLSSGCEVNVTASAAFNSSDGSTNPNGYRFEFSNGAIRTYDRASASNFTEFKEYNKDVTFTSTSQLTLSGSSTSANNIYIGYYEKRSKMLGGTTPDVQVTNITITYDVTLPSTFAYDLPSDNNAPRAEISNSVDGSYITAGNIGNYAQGELIGSIGQIAGAPVLSNNHVDLTVGATRKGSIGVDEVGVDNKYAKKVQLNINEINADGGNASVTQATYYAGLAGITVGGNELSPTLYPTSAQGAVQNGAFSYGGGSDNGYFVWKVNDQGRTSGILTLYFNDNVEDLAIKVADSGGTALTLTVTVGGIKTGGDDLTGSASITDESRMKDANSASFDGLTWEWDDLTPVFANMGSGANAQIWFYAVQRFDSPAEAAGADALFPETEWNSGITPIGFTDADGRWTAASGLTAAGKSGFDFTTGLLYGVAPVNGGSATGSGYYRFEFYPMNYAGYISKTPVVRLVKADVGIAEPEVTLSYNTSSESGNPLVAGTQNDGHILDDQLAYISTDLTVTIAFAGNRSGNKVSVMGADGENYIFLIGADGIKGVYTVSNNTLQDASGWTDGAEYSMTGSVFDKVVVSASVADGRMTVMAVYTAPADKITEKTHTFTIYTNADDISGQAMANCLSDYDTDWEEWMTEDGTLGSGTRLWFDHIGIDDVTFGDEYAGETTGVIPAGDARNWFTNEWAYGGDLTISTTDEYQYIFYKLAYYTEDFSNPEGTSGDYAAVKGEFGSNAYFESTGVEVIATGGWTLLDSGVRIDFTNITENQAGYYVVYVITADRASHFDFTAFGVLVDATDYEIRAEYDAETLEVLGDIDPFGLNEIGEQTLKRGGLYTFTPELKDEYIVAGAHMYVPYQVKKAVLEASGYNYVYIYSHAANDTTGEFKKEYLRANYLYASIAADGDGIGIGLDLDVDRNSVAQLPAANGQTAIVFSFRQVVNVSFDNAAQYTGEHIDIQVNAYDLNGGQVTIAEGNEPYALPKYQGTGTYEGVTNAGSYGFLLDYKSTDFGPEQIEEHSQYYVLAKVANVTLNVSKVELSLDVKLTPSGTLYYGDVTGDNAVEKLGLSYEITGGLVGQDDVPGKTFDGLTGKSVVASVVGASSGVYLDAGSHNVTVAFSTTNYNVSVEWTTAQVMQIEKRELAFTVESPANVTYGNAMPLSYTVRMDKSVFDFDTLGKYKTAENVGNMLGVTVSSETTEEGEQWVFSFNADAFAAFTPEVNGKGYYNVGDYAITGFDVEKTSVNNNFAPTQTGESKVTVVARVVTVSPQLPGVVNVESLDELKDESKFTFSIATAGNDDVTKFGIDGNFGVSDNWVNEDVPGKEYTYAITGDVLTFTSDHNTDDVTNVEIKFGNESAWTFKVVIITAAGQFVIEFKDAGIFIVTYGELFDAETIAANAEGKYYNVLYYTKDTDGNYTVASTAPEGVTLNVTITAAGYLEDLYANHAGNYNLTVSALAENANTEDFYTYAYRIADGAPLPSYVTVETLQAKATVSNAGELLSKPYGANDPTIDPDALFTFAFTSAHQELLDAFIAANGTIRVRGIGTTWNRTASVGKYDYNWSNCTFHTSAGDIASGDIRFEIEDDADVKFEITPKVLDFNALVESGGILVTAAGKDYDGETAAEGASLSFASGDTIVVAGEVALGYDANYWNGTGYVAEVGSGYAVRFANIVLTGAGVNNYTLVIADEAEGYGFYFDYNGTDGEGFGISPEAVTFLTTFFSVFKTFDGGTGMKQDNIAFNPGTGFEAFGNSWSLVEGKFDSANAGTGILVTFKILCPEVVYPNVTEKYPIEAYYIMPEGLALTAVNGAGEKGVYIEVTGNVTGEIGQFTLRSTHINFTFEPADRTKVYDGNGVFDVPFEFNDTIKKELVEGFDFGSIGLEFAGETDKNVGDHAMKITGVSITDKTNFRLGMTLDGTDVGDGGTATGSDYATIEGMINGISGGKPFSITRETLTFDVAFEGVNVYAGLETLSATTPATIYGVIDGEELNITASTYKYAKATAEGGYETFVYVQAERFDEASGNYYHDVLITITVSTGNGFDWNNYTLEGLNKVDGKGNEFTVFREGAAILNPKQVTLNLSEISVKDGGKVYDATTDIELIFPEKVYEEQFFESDLAKLDFTYTAALDSANVGTRNVNISDIKPVLKEANAAETHILDSYSIKFSGSFTKTAVVDPVEVNVEFTIPDKTYDGTRFVNMSAAEGSLVAPKDSGRDTWYVAAEQFVNNYYVSVVAAYYDDVNVARDPGTNNPIAKKGTVIGFELVCTQGTSNYVLVGVEGEEKGVLYNLYSFPAGTNISSAYEYIDGVVTEGHNTYYLVRENNTAAQEEIGTLSGKLYATRSYNTAAATGRILPAQIDFKVEITNPDAFTKAFDDTTALVTEPTLGTDYRIIVEQIGVGDITGITVSFSGAAVGRQDVIFAVSQTAESNPNYSFNAGDSYTVRGGGYIKKFGGTINAELVSEEGGITATYGTADLSYTVRYYYISATEVVDIIVDAEGNAYVTLDGWKAMFGHDDDDLTADVMTRRYTKANGEWQQSNIGNYIRITGKFGTPTLLTAEGGDKFVDKDGLVCVNAGTYAAAYLDVKADSFDFKIHTASVTIEAKDLRVYVTNAGGGGNFTADYFVGKLPVPVFGLFMAGEVNDLAAFDTWAAVQKTLRGQFMNGETPLTSTDVPTGNYALKVTTTTGNYNVIIVTEAGETAEHKLVITIPKLDKTQYKVKTNLKRQYELGADGQGVALDKSDLLNATAVADGNNIIVITWTDANGNKFDAPPSDVGTYKWALTVTKKIGGSQEDYIYEGKFTAEGEFTIEKRRITVSLKESVGFTYDDGKAHVITKEDLTAKDADGNADEFIALISNNITYLLNGTSCADMTNAGGYTVVLEFVDSPNYELVNNVGTVYVKAKPITVKVDPASKVYDATNGINGNVGISFTAEGADASDFSVVYRSAGNVVGAITTPGIYTYTIVSKDPNYTVSGESTGNFNVQISKVTYTKDDIDYVTITFGSPVAVNYYLNDTAVAQGSGYWNIVDANVQKLAGEDGGLVTNGIIRIEMSNNNGVVSTVPGGVTVTARIPAGVGSDFTLYRVTSSGGLEVVEDYTVANGVVTYTTDYISNLVFVGTAPVAGFPWWIIPIIAAALVLTLALAILIAVLVKLHRAPDPIPVEVTPIDSIMPEPPVPAPAAPVAPVIVEVPAADIAPTVYDAPAAVSKHKQPPIIGIR